MSPSLRRVLLPHHSYVGLLLAVLPTVTICLGLLEKTTFMQIAATRSQADEVSYGRWLSNSAGVLSLACMAAVVYVLVSGEEAGQSGQAVADEEAEEAAKGGRAEVVEADNGSQVEGQRSVFNVQVPYPSETSSLLQSADDGKGVEQPLRGAEEVAPPASFTSYVDQMLNQHFSRRASREGHSHATEVRVDEYGSTAQYRREQDRHSRPPTGAVSSAGARKSGGTATERAESGGRSRIEVERLSPESPESMWPRFKGVGENGVVLKSP